MAHPEVRLFARGLALMCVVFPASLHAEPAWPQSRTECEDWADRPPAGVREKWNEDVSERYLVRVVPTLGGIFSGGLNGGHGVSDGSVDGTPLGYGWRLGARADLGLVSPLWVSASGYVNKTQSAHSVHLDAVVGYSFVRYGTRWVKAGAAAVGDTVATWSSHCQLRRNEFSLFAGGKSILTSTSVEGRDAQDVTALQVGFGEAFVRAAGTSLWNLAALYDPTNTSYGGQATLGFSGGFIPAPVYMGMNLGGLIGERDAYWATLDLGVLFEL